MKWQINLPWLAFGASSVTSTRRLAVLTMLSLQVSPDTRGFVREGRQKKTSHPDKFLQINCVIWATETHASESNETLQSTAFLLNENEIKPRSTGGSSHQENSWAKPSEQDHLLVNPHKLRDEAEGKEWCVLQEKNGFLKVPGSSPSEGARLLHETGVPGSALSEGLNYFPSQASAFWPSVLWVWIYSTFLCVL